MNDQTKKIEALIADIGRLQKQNADLQTKLEKTAELANINTELSKAKGDLSRQVDHLIAQLNEANDDAKTAQSNVQMLKAKLATKDTATAIGNDKALLEKVKGLEEKKDSLEAALAEWTELAKVCLCLLLWSWSLTVSALLQGIQGHAAYVQGRREAPPGCSR